MFFFTFFWSYHFADHLPSGHTTFFPIGHTTSDWSYHFRAGWYDHFLALRACTSHATRWAPALGMRVAKDWGSPCMAHAKGASPARPVPSPQFENCLHILCHSSPCTNCATRTRSRARARARARVHAHAPARTRARTSERARAYRTRCREVSQNWLPEVPSGQPDLPRGSLARRSKRLRRRRTRRANHKESTSA